MSTKVISYERLFSSRIIQNALKPKFSLTTLPFIKQSNVSESWRATTGKHVLFKERGYVSHIEEGAKNDRLTFKFLCQAGGVADMMSNLSIQAPEAEPVKSAVVQAPAPAARPQQAPQTRAPAVCPSKTQL
jgi:hypothetical protein